MIKGEDAYWQQLAEEADNKINKIKIQPDGHCSLDCQHLLPDCVAQPFCMLFRVTLTGTNDEADRCEACVEATKEK